MTTWTATDKSAQEVPDLQLLIEDSYELLIGEGFSLLIQEGDEGTDWTATNKDATSWTATNKS